MMLKLGETSAVRHTQLGYTIECSTLNTGLGDLSRDGARTQRVAEDDLESKHGGLGQRTTMITDFLLPALATHAPNTPQVLVAWQRRLGRVTVPPDMRVTL